MKKTPTEIAMQKAVLEARRWIGATYPNPPVGAAALNSNGDILAVAAHGQMGATHAEAALIEICRMNKMLDKVHTICVTLEPCNHTGNTPPCAEAIIKSGIKRVAIGTKDPNPHVKGGGTEHLRDHGIEVITGIEESACKQLIYAFAHSMKTGKPWVTVKRAFDEHGSMIPPMGQKTFTSKDSLVLAHLLRKRADAIMTGSETVIADNPLFTVRKVKDHASKKRYLAIMDRRRRISDDFMQNAKNNGLVPIIYDDVLQAYDDLFSRGAYEILVEAGPKLSQSVLDNGLWNMLLNITKGPDGEPDKIETVLNPRSFLPFDANEWQLENMLPYEYE